MTRVVRKRSVGLVDALHLAETLGGLAALIAGGADFYLVMNPTLWPSTGQGAGYQCRRNAYDCSDFRTRAQAQAAYQACGGLQNDVQRLDRDWDGRACERLP